MGRPSNTEARREQIASALLTVMARKGYDGASVADVAAAAGLAPGLVHYHFANKLEILLAVLDGLAAVHDASLARALESAGGDPARELAAFIDVHLSLERADPEALAGWVTVSGEALRETKVQRAFAAAIGRTVETLEGVVRRGVKAKVFRCREARAAACSLVATIQGYFVLAATTPGLIPRGSAARAVHAMAGGLLAPARLPGRGRST